MSMHSTAGVIFLSLLCLSFTSIAVEEQDQLPGRALTSEETLHLNSHVFPNGEGLPEGTGTISDGRIVYDSHCAACHGQRGEGASAVELIGDRELLNTEFPDKGIGVYWPYAPTLFEYIKRAMPPDNPGSFTPQQLYSVTGYVLYLNDLLPENTSVNSKTLTEIVMPNRDGFTNKYP